MKEVVEELHPPMRYRREKEQSIALEATDLGEYRRHIKVWLDPKVISVKA